VELDGEDERVYPRVNYPRKIAVAGIVNSLEGASSRLIRR
jgi:putative transposase